MDALLQAGLGTPRLADFLCRSSSTGVHSPFRGSSPSCARGRALGGGDCVRGRTVRSGRVGDQGGAQPWFHPERTRNAGRGQARPEAQRPPRAVAKLSKKFEAEGERSLGVGVSPVLQLPLRRGAEPEKSCFSSLAARGTDWVGTSTPTPPHRARPRVVGGAFVGLRGRRPHACASVQTRALAGQTAAVGPSSTRRLWRDFGRCCHQARLAPALPRPPGDSETRRLLSSGEGPGYPAGCDAVLRPRVCASQCWLWEFYATGLSTNPKGWRAGPTKRARSH